YAYVPLLGIFIAAVWAAAAVAPRALAVCGVCAVAALAAVTQRQVGYWANSIALFEHARDVTTLNYVAHTNLGLAYNKQKRWEEAIASFKRALKIQPNSAEALGHMGLAYAR